jgi:hypothetical protein
MSHMGPQNCALHIGARWYTPPRIGRHVSKIMSKLSLCLPLLLQLFSPPHLRLTPLWSSFYWTKPVSINENDLWWSLNFKSTDPVLDEVKGTVQRDFLPLIFKNGFLPSDLPSLWRLFEFGFEFEKIFAIFNSYGGESVPSVLLSMESCDFSNRL